MARSGYQYGTSPRKIEPNYDRRTKKKKAKKQLRIVENKPKQQIRISEEQRKRRSKLVMAVASLFLILLAISFRNSQIDKAFNKIQEQKRELATIQKENEQLKISIENSMNLSNIEKVAKEELGMQKLTSSQTVYVSLPKKDYVEAESEKVVIEDDENLWNKIVNKILNFKN